MSFTVNYRRQCRGGKCKQAGLVLLSERRCVSVLTEQLELKDGWCGEGSRITSGHFS